MTAKSLLLSAGHSNEDPGVVAQGRREADLAVEFRNLVSFYLMRYGIPHSLDGTGTVNYPLNTAARMAAQHDLAVEFHCNGAEDPTATGAEALAGPEDMLLAASLSRAMATTLAIRDRGAKPENSGHHSRLAFVSGGSGIILELFFLTNRSDLTAYYNRKWLAAKAVADVLVRAAQ